MFLPSGNTAPLLMLGVLHPGLQVVRSVRLAGVHPDLVQVTLFTVLLPTASAYPSLHFKLAA